MNRMPSLRRPVELTLGSMRSEPGGDVGQQATWVAVGEQGVVEPRGAQLRDQSGEPQVAGLAEPAQRHPSEPVVRPALLTVAARSG